MKKNSGNQTILALCSALLLIGCADEKQSKTSTVHKDLPNIIWLVAEDQSPGFFPMYGDSTMELPNLVSLAKDGVVYNNAVSPVPVCAPARSGLITGMYPSTLGTHNMRTYNANRKLNQPKIGLSSYSPVVPQGVKMFTEYLRNVGYYTSNNAKEDYNFKRTNAAWDQSDKNAHWRGRKKDQPFFAVFNFGVCHESQIWARGKDTLYVDPEKVPIPPYFPEDAIIKHDLAVNYSNLKRLDDQIGEILGQLKEDGLYDNSIIFFYGDHGGPFPRHKRALYDTGVRVPLVIKFQNGQHAGTFDDQLISFIDYAPSVLSLAGIEPPKVMQGKALMGKYRTADASKYTYHTSDRFDAVYDRLRAVRSERFKYIRSYDTTISHAIPVAYREQMAMMQRLRVLFEEGKLNEDQAAWLQPNKPSEELYDLQNDPYELANLASNPTYKDTLSLYSELLDNWIKETKDLGEYTEQQLMEAWLINGEQPQLDPLEMEERKDGIFLYSKNNDATISWKQPKDSVWTIYKEPIPLNTPFEAMAERIGYDQSELLKME